MITVSTPSGRLGGWVKVRVKGCPLLARRLGTLRGRPLIERGRPGRPVLSPVFPEVTGPRVQSKGTEVTVGCTGSPVT